MGFCCDRTLLSTTDLRATGFSRRLRSPTLPFPYLDSLEPYMSRRTLEMHWGEHHRGYVEGLNKQLEKNDILYGHTITELIKVTYNNGNPLPEFNNAAEVWNHEFFWESMQPGGEKMPRLGFLEQIEKDFGSFTNLKEKFVEEALTLFGSGWVWLVSYHRFGFVGACLLFGLQERQGEVCKSVHKSPCVLACSNRSHGPCPSFCKFRGAKNSCCLKFFSNNMNIFPAVATGESIYSFFLF
ncbi:superoxide dismutase [Fe] 3, chloroplastic isoform X3 [Malania oleifera]|uniref:superoxide dismutase [Fe] 3, chloroplastic isoform X3 n=1 Tax=Malania oleifera TaxID=397392 RepID=UPI0025AE663A|nr:superoxide dismutase [Fe] 3, chloroplastic isoform X3 [Malania oleifera]